MAAKVQIKRTATPNNPPAGLAPGELAVEMDTPTRLWVGVPTAIDASGKRQLNNSYSKAEIDAANAAQDADIAARVLRAGDTMTGHLSLPTGPAAANAVRKDYVDGLLGGLAAAPFDALAYNGIQINGAMEVSQEFGTNVITTSGKYSCDGWKLDWIGTMAMSWAQFATGGPPGIPYAIATSVTTPQTSLSASDFILLGHRLEISRIRRLAWGTANAQPITIGFWTCHHRPGVYGGSVRHSSTYVRSYAFTYTHNVADVWQYNTVTVPGNTASASLNSTVFDVNFALASGTTYAAPAAGAWYDANYVTAAGQVNSAAAVTDSFRITGVSIIPGIAAPSAAQSPLIMRPFDQELQLCRRYYQKSYLQDVLPGAAGTSGGIFFLNGLAAVTNAVHSTVMLGVSMRVAPTMKMYSPQTGASGKVWDNSNAADVNGLITGAGHTWFVWNAVTAVATSNMNFWFQWTADARF